MICDNCKRIHDGNFGSGRFCSRSCANTRIHSNETKLKISKSLGGNGKIENICPNCKEILKNKQKKFCSRKCQNDFQYKEYIKKWKNNEIDGRKGKYGTSNHIHRYIREKYGNKCSICGWNEVNKITGNVPVQLEHKNGNWWDNNEHNLTLLCPNCHSLTETYCNLNIGKGRNKSGWRS